jgi:hypothetical protein
MKAISDYYVEYIPTVLAKSESGNESESESESESEGLTHSSGADNSAGDSTGTNTTPATVPGGRPATAAEEANHADAVGRSMVEMVPTKITATDGAGAVDASADAGSGSESGSGADLVYTDVEHSDLVVMVRE